MTWWKEEDLWKFNKGVNISQNFSRKKKIAHCRSHTRNERTKWWMLGPRVSKHRFKNVQTSFHFSFPWDIHSPERTKEVYVIWSRRWSAYLYTVIRSLHLRVQYRAIWYVTAKTIYLKLAFSFVLLLGRVGGLLMRDALIWGPLFAYRASVIVMYRRDLVYIGALVSHLIALSV